MASVAKKTAIVCLTEDEFEEKTKFRNVKDVHEFYHVTTLNGLNVMDFVTNVIFLNTAKELSEFQDIVNHVKELGITQTWQ